MIQLVLKLVLVAQELFLIEFIGQNKVKIFNKNTKFVKIVSHQKRLEKRTKKVIIF